MTTSNQGEFSGGPGLADGQRFDAVETFDSRELQVQGGQRTRRRRFIVYARAGAGAVLPSDNYAAQVTGVAYGDAHPEDIALRALDVSVRVLPETGRGAMEVVWGYRQGELSGPEPDDPEAPGYQQVDLTGEAQFVDVYRQDADIPPDGIPPAGRPDIGGEPVDVAGEPISQLLRVPSYSVVTNVPLSQYQAQTIIDLTGTRNAGPFLGFPVGSVLYGRPRSSRIAQGVVRITHQLLVDQERLHLRQQAAADTDGVRTSTDVPGGTPGDLHASRVYHVQPFPNLADFTVLGITGA
jgi:hypothetical protein